MRFREFVLREYRRDTTAQNFGKKIVSVARRDNTIPFGFRNADVTDADLLNMVMTTLEESDPTTNKEYSQTLAKLYANGGIRFEDLGSTVAEYLTKFHKLKQKKQIPSPRNDFMRYTDIGDFYSVVDEYPDPEGKEQQDKGQAQEYYNDADIRIIVPADQTAACYYGQGTRWCTAGRTGNMFNTYHNQGPLYIILPKQPAYPGEKYQLHFESGQYMDERDESVDLKDVVARHPGLTRAFVQQAKQFGEVDLMTPEAAKPYVELNRIKFEEYSSNLGNGIRSINAEDRGNDATGFNDAVCRIVRTTTGKDPGNNAGLNIGYAYDYAWILVSTNTGEIRTVYTDKEGFEVYNTPSFDFNVENWISKDPALQEAADDLQSQLERWMKLNAAAEEPGDWDDEFDDANQELEDDPEAADRLMDQIMAKYGRPKSRNIR